MDFLQTHRRLVEISVGSEQARVRRYVVETLVARWMMSQTPRATDLVGDRAGVAAKRQPRIPWLELRTRHSHTALRAAFNSGHPSRRGSSPLFIGSFLGGRGTCPAPSWWLRCRDRRRWPGRCGSWRAGQSTPASIGLGFDYFLAFSPISASSWRMASRERSGSSADICIDGAD